MSGHSKWSTIKRKKAATDAARGKVFTKFIKEITIAARAGGGDPDANPRLRTAIMAAKSVNMPAANIERAIKKGAGGPDAAAYEEVTYEGYGPSGVAMLVDVATDNRNRAAGEIRHIFDKYGGHMAAAGSVAYMFKLTGVIMVEKSAVAEDVLMETVLEAGAEDVHSDGDMWEVLTPPAALEPVREALVARQVPIANAELTKLASVTVPLNERAADTALRLVDMLEDNDDVQKVYANFVVTDEVLAKPES
jgi:YebC/PmpR family DNA-binding regulatory protein